MLLDNMLAVLLGGKFLELPLPAGRQSRNPKSWGSSIDLVNGSTAVVASELFSRSLELQWPHVVGRDMEALRWLAYAGTQPLLYQDLAIASSPNVLSPLLARPYLLASSLTPVAWGIDGQRLARVNAEKGLPGIPALEFIRADIQDKQVHDYVEEVLIPPNYELHVLAQGTDLGPIVSVNGIGVRDNEISKVTATMSEHRTAKIQVKAYYRGGVLKSIRGILQPLGAQAPSKGSLMEFRDGQGMTTMAVQPGSFNETLTVLYSGRPINTASVVLQEVWPWL